MLKSFVYFCVWQQTRVYLEWKKKTPPPPSSLLEISIMKHHECCFCEVSVVKSMVEFSTKWWSPLGLRAETQNGLNNNRGEHILGQRSASEEIQRFIVKSRRLGVDNTSGWNFKKKSFCEFPWWYTSEPQLWTYCISVPGLPLICCFSFLFSPWLFIYFCSLLFFSLGDLFPHRFFFLSLIFPFIPILPCPSILNWPSFGAEEIQCSS